MKVKIFVFLVCYSISRAPNSLQYMKTRISLLSSVHLLVEPFVNLYPSKAACGIFFVFKAELQTLFRTSPASYVASHFHVSLVFSNRCQFLMFSSSFTTLTLLRSSVVIL